MGSNDKIADAYNNLMAAIEVSLRKKFPDIIWVVGRYDDIKNMGRTESDLDGYEKPKGIFITGDINKGNNEFEGRNTYIESDVVHAAAMSNFNDMILKAAEKLRKELLETIK